jgi:fumarylacetoacetate (FAA) hydrolase
MKLATQRNGTRDGQLLVVSSDGTRALAVPEIAPNLQTALDNWAVAEPKLRAVSTALNQTTLPNEQMVDPQQLMAPLPRAYEWIDGSAYINHVVLVRKARGAEPPATLRTDPLVYQGGSGRFLGPREPIEHFSEEYGIDFESEVTAIVGDVPMGTPASEAAPYVRLLMLANDVTLRNLVPAELEKGFGFFVSKPATGFSPFAITPDELGEAWHDGRVHLRLQTKWNGKIFGDTDAGLEMHFSFFDLLAHATKTRQLTAGTIIGSGTVSNADPARGASCIAEVRMREKIATGAFQTAFMKFGDTVDIEMWDASGRSLFGAIRQVVAKAGARS